MYILNNCIVPHDIFQKLFEFFFVENFLTINERRLKPFECYSRS